ncbi:hypothetical protein VNO80_03212 [Phaseolus coccineus]|uniref:NADH-ubiquinone oxidoreductase chain 4 n=1 Tax=Phaseolus coccineus TaxID=3886 RepID=A0AAN9RIM3_PHACN
MPRAPAMPACLAPRRCPHASRPGDARMPRALAMPACLAPRRCPHASRPGDARMPRAPAMPACLAPRRCPHASRPGDARMPRAPAMPDDTSPRLPEGSSFHYVTSKAALHLSSQRALFCFGFGRRALRSVRKAWFSWSNDKGRRRKLRTEPYDAEVSRTADLQISLTTEFSERRQIFLWIASFAAFAVKVPMVPVHIWLPKAHVEAPTAGSVILAGIPSKLGTHGFLRFSIPMFLGATLCSTPFIYTPSAIPIIYTSLTTSIQIDLKKIIAYSSVAHMNLVTIGMFSLAAAIRSPIFRTHKTRPKHVCRACDPSTY